MGAPKKGSHKGTPSGGSRGKESAPRKSRSVSLSKTPRPAHQRYRLGTAKENPGHVKGSKARHLPGQLKASRTQVLEDKASGSRTSFFSGLGTT